MTHTVAIVPIKKKAVGFSVMLWRGGKRKLEWNTFWFYLENQTL